MKSNRRYVVAFGGRPGAGKDHYCRILRDKYGFRHMSFAHPLRNEVDDVLQDREVIPPDVPEELWELLFFEKYKGPWDWHPLVEKACRWLLNKSRSHLAIQYYIEDKLMEMATGLRRPNIWVKPTPTRQRRILQLWGTEYRRAKDPDYWVKKMDESIKDDGLYCISDLRFADGSELPYIKELGGSTIFLSVPDYLQTAKQEYQPHVSESLRPEDCDYHYINLLRNQEAEEDVLEILRIDAQKNPYLREILADRGIDPLPVEDSRDESLV